MNKKSTKALSLLLSILIIFASFPFTAAAAANTATSKDKNYQYTVLYSDDNNTYIRIDKCLINKENVYIPQSIDGYIVKGLYNAFNKTNNEKVKNIVLDEGIEFIDSYTFQNMQDISITLPESLIYIGASCFQNARITSINLSDNILAIDNSAFSGTVFGETDICLPKSLKYLGNSAFDNSNIERISLGGLVQPADNINYSYSGNVTANTIDFTDDEQFKWNSFSDCSYLESIEIDENNPFFSMQGDMLLTKDLTYLIYILTHSGKQYETLITPRTIESINGSAIDETLNVHNFIITNNVKSLDDFCFENANIEKITFENGCSIKEIPMGAFAGSSVKDILIPGSIEKIGCSAFEGSAITALNFETPSSCATIEESAFQDCESLKSVFLPNSLIKMGYIKDTGYNTNFNASARSKVFYNCISLEIITFEDNSKLKHWESSNFSNCPNIKEINTGKNNSVEQIYCGFGFSSLPDSNNKLEMLDFSNCPNLYYIEDYAFSRFFALKSVNLSGTKITSLNSNTFYTCKSLEEVILSDCTESIGSSAFSNCLSLSKINLDNVLEIAKNAFEGCESLGEIDTTRIKGEYNGLQYYELSSSVVIYGYSGTQTDIVIPDYINEKPVTKIKTNAFKGINISTIEFPESLEYIGDYAFEDCGITSEIDLPHSLTYIGEGAFAGNRITGVLTIPDGVAALYKNTFKDAQVNKFNIGNGVTSLSHNSMNGTFTSLIIPDSVINLDFDFTANANIRSIYFGKNSYNIENVLNYRNKDSLDVNKLFNMLEVIEISPENPYYSMQDGILYNKDKTILLLCVRNNNSEKLIIPETVKTVAGFAFSKASAHSVIFSEGLEKIEEYAFYNSNIIEVFIPGTVNTIGWWAFQKSQKLIKAEFGSGIKLDSLYETFADCSSLKTVIFPDDAEIRNLSYTFEGTSIKSIEIPYGTVYMEGTFERGNLESIVLPDSLEYIGFKTFWNNNLESIVIPNKVSVIGESAFGYCCSLTYINLNNVNAINKGCFENCTSLESIDLTGVTYTASDAFKGCNNLKKFYFTKEEKEAYIAENEFKGNETIETIVVGNSITSIEDNAFADCTSLETALIADSVTSIADTAFDNCENLTIVCTEDSYAEVYAARKNIPYTTFIAEPIADQLYTGREITPKVNVRAKNESLTENTDYSVVYTNNINVGTANANIIGLGDYSIFACLMKFNIIPNPDIKDDTENMNNTQNNQKPAVSETDHKNNTGHNGGSSASDTNRNAVNNNSLGGSVLNSESNGTGNSASAAGTASQNGSTINSSGKEDFDNLQNGAQNGNHAGESTAEAKNSSEANGSSSTDNAEKELSRWEKFINMVLSFFEKVISFFKNLFS